MRRVQTIKGPIFVSQTNDFFTLFDILAKKDHKTYWIQVKSNDCNTSRCKKPISKFYDDLCNTNNEVVQIWQRVPRRGFKIFTFKDGLWNYQQTDLSGKIL